MGPCAEGGNVVECGTCCKARHSILPLHTIQKWTGKFWEKSSLRSLGHIVSLGHNGRDACPFPSSEYAMVILDSNGIHSISVKFCGCSASTAVSKRVQLLRLGWYPATVVDPQTCATFRVLEHFSKLKLNGGLNAHDFVAALEQLTVPLTSRKFRYDRYKTFSRIHRQWAFLKRMKRAGRAHDVLGPSGTKAGELAVLCWACPHGNINLPPDWREVDPKFLYSLILAMDANFRLKNRSRSGNNTDAALFLGPYLEHLKNYTSEADISSCIVFAALTQKDTRLTTGLRSSGVGACICARHKIVRPLGGFMQVLLLMSLMTVILSYDISCQYKKNFWSRMDNMPTQMQLSSDNINIEFALPSWHANAHTKICQSENSIAYHTGVGRTDGEGIERSWAAMNQLASSTKEMGPGARQDTLDDHFSFHNWEKNIKLGDLLSRRLIVAIGERQRQVENFREVTNTLNRDTIKAWKDMLCHWEEDSTNSNPYEIDRSGTLTEPQVRLQLRNDELQDITNGRPLVHETSATAFLVAGLQLEDIQQRISLDSRAQERTANQASLLEDRRIACLSKLKTFRDLQRVYMPGALRCIQLEEESRNPDNPAPNAGSIKLWLPSELPMNERRQGCSEGLPRMETKLREAQCHDSLDMLRSRLHAKAHLINFRNKNTRGQIQSTRSRTLISHISQRAMLCANKYRRARLALIALCGDSFDDHTFKVLEDSHLQLDGDGEDDAQARHALARAGRDTGPQTKRKGNGKKVLSWIWTAGGGPDEENAGVHQCNCTRRMVQGPRTESSLSEEVDLLREEMRRIDAPTVAGLQAYSARQAHIHTAIAVAFKTKWSLPAVAAARAAVSDDADVDDINGDDIDGDDV
ncbi:hypothetical protein BJ138DRAFT_1138372 [Hygrophoropsis aurantiaca]|uniref:Uncharacterized protein n=1 Tax=Hygrophoropsis aurantiaca TaxID=72124 RepID=A0ACB7ZXK9_9AGAM|nr:hypothetical protein BJ138DRAFT_1138372 [Hygrophoropsis aurantiaca]